MSWGVGGVVEFGELKLLSSIYSGQQPAAARLCQSQCITTSLTGADLQSSQKLQLSKLWLFNHFPFEGVKQS